MAEQPPTDVELDRLPTDDDLARLPWTTLVDYHLKKPNPANGLIRDKTGRTSWPFQWMDPARMMAVARSKPPGPREGSNPTSPPSTTGHRPHVLRAACLRTQAQHMENVSWPSTCLPVPTSTISAA